MGPALRRSRRSTPKKVSSYNIGDIVETYRGGRVLRGRLAYNLTEGVSPNPRWLVTFDNQTHKDEELYEKELGKILRRATGEKDRSFQASRRARSLPSSSETRKHLRNSGSSEEREEREFEKKRKKKKLKSVSFPDGETPVQSDESSSNMKKSSAREQRSRRRQAKIEEDVVGGPSESGKSFKTRFSSLRAGNDEICHKRSKEGQEVVKVKLLTGTLYLYRGLHRRAEFIRRV